MARWRQILVALALFIPFAHAENPAVRLLAEGRSDQAISVLQARIDASPADAESYNLLCRAYFQLGNWDRGVPQCEKATALQPGNSRYHLWLGRIYGEKADTVSFFSAAGLARKVRNEFESAVQLDPDSVDARTDLAEFYLEAPGIIGGGRDKAEAQAQALVPLNPAKAYWVRGRIAEKKKETAEAEKQYRAAIEAGGGSALNWLNLALFFRHVQRWDDMEAALNHAVAAPLDRPEVVMESADVLVRTGRNFTLAIQLCRRYLAGDTVEEGPTFKAHYLIGVGLEKQGDQQGAAQEFRAALALARGYTRAQDALNRLGH